MTSMNFDGEMIAQCIRRFGYGAARGSTSRGGMRALVQMAQEIRSGKDAGFTIDGPRGPRYVAQEGAVLLAHRTGAAIFCFHIALKNRIQLNSWDHFQIPLPFTEAIVLQAAPIWAPPKATKEELRDLQEKVQSVLDDLRVRGDSWWQTRP